MKPVEGSKRLQWDNLPSEVIEAVEELLGDPVESSFSQSGGYSPGTADRIVTTSGKRAFVKAVGVEQNKTSTKLHRAEARKMGFLPSDITRPEFIGHHDQGDWIALVFSDVEGRNPHLPWRSDELTCVLDAVHEYTQAPLGDEAMYSLSSLGNQRFYAFQGWDRLREEPLETLDQWAKDNIDLLDELSADAASAVDGASLVHADLRADNLIVSEDGKVTVVDWPWAALGAPWFDALGLLIDVLVYSPDHDVESVLSNHEVFATATPAQINAVLSGLAGYYLDAARSPAPEGITTLRSFQQREGEAVLEWLKRRLQK